MVASTTAAVYALALTGHSAWQFKMAGATQATTVAADVPPKQTGVFVLVGGTQKIDSNVWFTRDPNFGTMLNLRQFTNSGMPITKCDAASNLIGAMVAVRDDFAYFDDLACSFNERTATLRTPFAEPRGHKYYVYVNTLPHGFGRQVFRFTIDSGTPFAHHPPSGIASAPLVRTGPYTIILGTTTIAANKPYALSIAVYKGYQLAADLIQSNLGESAWALLIDTATLRYVSAIPTVRGKTTGDHVSPNLVMALPALPAGTYRLWLRIKGGGFNVNEYVAPFTLVAR